MSELDREQKDKIIYIVDQDKAFEILKSIIRLNLDLVVEFKIEMFGNPDSVKCYLISDLEYPRTEVYLYTEVLKANGIHDVS